MLRATIEKVAQYKQLGSHITGTLNGTHHINQLTSSANKTPGFLECNLSCVPTAAKLLAYETLVLSKLKYANII